MESKKKKRLFIHVGDIRIAPDIISAYAPISNPTNPTGVQIIFPNGRYLEIKTTQQEQQRVIATLDKLKESTTVKQAKNAPEFQPGLCRI